MNTVPDPQARPFEGLDELTLLATLVAGEARGEPYEGKVAVAWVARNRVLSGQDLWFGRGWHGVILKPWQFSCFNAKDPNRLKLANPYRGFGEQVWRACYRAAAGVYFGFEGDPTHGADHYHTEAVDPSWKDPDKETCKISRHIFYKLRN